MLRRNTREHHYLADTHHALGRALEKLGRGEEALRAYEQGLRVALEDDSPYGSSVGEYRGDPVGVYRAKAKELGRTH